jgi:hypothetical protein
VRTGNLNRNNISANQTADIFGEWIEDEDDLPAYRYDMRHDDPRAVWNPVIKPKSNLHWHQLGNDRITANAYNLGMVKVFYGETGQLWLNEYDPAANAHCGGFGWVITDDAILIDRDDCIPEGAEWVRIFGTGYFLKRLSCGGIVYERRIFAPAGDEPVLISEVKILNNSDKTKDIRLVEYWDVNISRITKFVLNRFLNRKIRNRVRLNLNQEENILSAAPHKKSGRPLIRPCYIDPELPIVFLACLDGKPEGWITEPALCTSLNIQSKEGIAASALARLLAMMDRSSLRSWIHQLKQSPVLNQEGACLAAVMHANIEPGEEKVFRFVYGYAKSRLPEEIVTSVVSSEKHLWENTAAYWKEKAPSFKSAPSESNLGRELEWNNYYFSSSSLYDAYYQRHYIPQAGNYLYDSGLNGASRDFFENILTLNFYKPEAAKEALEFMMSAQGSNGAFFYNIDGFGKRNRLFYRPSDIGLWFLWALSEYVFATRDFSFLEEAAPYYPLSNRKHATVWEHAKTAFSHLLKKVGVGRNGHLKIRLSDWNDEMTWITAADNPFDIIMTILRGESVLNTAMACYILPMFESLARYTGDTKTKDACFQLLSGLRIALNSAWHENHLIRSYSGFGKPFGKDETWLEPLVWALLAKGTLDPGKEHSAVNTINKWLLTPAGIKISDSGKGSMTTRKGEQESGGIWFAINSPAAIALSRFDKALAWEVFKKNTLAWHAALYPDKWYGIWSGPDAFNGPDSSRPGESWYQKSPVFSIGAQAYPVQNIHAHSQMMYAMARLAGISADAEGWTVSPKIPHDNFSFSCTLFGVDVTPGNISGFACLPVSAPLKLKVELPEGLIEPEVFVNGKEVNFTHTGACLEVSLNTAQSERVSWKIAGRRV